MYAYEERLRYRGSEVSVERLSSIRTTRAKCIVTRDAVDRRLKHAELFDLLVDPHEAYPIPLDAIDRPCEFGDAFASALEDAGLVVPCRAAAAARSPTPNGVSGG
jgi:hypothetical protein